MKTIFLLLIVLSSTAFSNNWATHSDHCAQIPEDVCLEYWTYGGGCKTWGVTLTTVCSGGPVCKTVPVCVAPWAYGGCMEWGSTTVCNGGATTPVDPQ
jgi:hypothetical protein